MNIKLKTSEGIRILPISCIKSVSALSQCNLLVTKHNGEQVQGISLEFK